jgi:hypothetical protein
MKVKFGEMRATRHIGISLYAFTTPVTQKFKECFLVIAFWKWDFVVYFKEAK